MHHWFNVLSHPEHKTGNNRIKKKKKKIKHSVKPVADEVDLCCFVSTQYFNCVTSQLSPYGIKPSSRVYENQKQYFSTTFLRSFIHCQLLQLLLHNIQQLYLVFLWLFSLLLMFLLLLLVCLLIWCWIWQVFLCFWFLTSALHVLRALETARIPRLLVVLPRSVFFCLWLIFSYTRGKKKNQI